MFLLMPGSCGEKRVNRFSRGLSMQEIEINSIEIFGKLDLGFRSQKKMVHNNNVT